MQNFLTLRLYQNNLKLVENTDNNDLHVTYHNECALRCYLIFLAGMSIFVWTKVQLTSMWHTLSISSTCQLFTSGTRGHLFGIHVLQVERRFSLDDKANDKLLHPTDDNLHPTDDNFHSHY